MNKSSIYNTLILLPIYWLFSGMLVMSGGDKPMAAMVIISIVTTLCCYGLSTFKVNIKQDKFLWVILAMTAFAIFSYYYHGYGSRLLRSLLCATLFLAFLPRKLVYKKLITSLLIIGSISTSIIPFYYGQWLNVERAFWPINAIPQATLSSAIGIAALVSAIEAPKKERYVLFIAFVISTIAVIISQSRGLWLGHFFACTMIFVVKLRHSLLTKKSILTTFGMMVIIGFILAPVVESRVESTKDEITQMRQGNFDTSFGVRLEMWMLAPKLVENNLFLGLGSIGHEKKFEELEQEGLVPDSVKLFRPTHYHNQFIDQIVKGGFVGVVLLASLFIVPLLLSLQMSPINRYIVSSLVLLYAIAGLTDVPLNHAQPILLYTILISCINTLKHNENHD